MTFAALVEFFNRRLCFSPVCDDQHAPFPAFQSTLEAHNLLACIRTKPPSQSSLCVHRHVRPCSSARNTRQAIRLLRFHHLAHHECSVQTFEPSGNCCLEQQALLGAVDCSFQVLTAESPQCIASLLSRVSCTPTGDGLHISHSACIFDVRESAWLKNPGCANDRNTCLSCHQVMLEQLSTAKPCIENPNPFKPGKQIQQVLADGYGAKSQVFAHLPVEAAEALRLLALLLLLLLGFRV